MGSAALAVSPPHMLPSPTYLLQGQRGKRGSLGAVQALLSSSQRVGHYQHWFSHKSKAQQHRGHHKTSPVHPGQTQHTLTCNRRWPGGLRLPKLPNKWLTQLV